MRMAPITGTGRSRPSVIRPPGVTDRRARRGCAGVPQPLPLAAASAAGGYDLDGGQYVTDVQSRVIRTVLELCS